MIFRFLCFLALAPALLAGSTSHVQAEILADHATIEPNTPFHLAVKLTMKDGWHTYWENPGSSGLATKLTWLEIPGLDLGPLEFPWPKRFVDEAGFITYGYDSEVLLLVRAQYHGALKELNLSAEVEWLECKEICLPGNQKLTLTLPVGKAQPGTNDFSATRQLIPRDWTPDAPFSYQFSLDARKEQWLATLTLKGKKNGWNPSEGFPELLPGPNPHAELISCQWQAASDGAQAKLTFNAWDAPAADFIHTAVLRGTMAGKEQVFRLVLRPAEASTPPAGVDAPSRRGWLLMLGFALLGGLILNLMPCVLPVLSLKIMSFIREAGESQTRRLALSLAYTVGILVCMEVIALFILATKLGVGAQFSYPGFNLAMAALLLVMALSFFNVFAFGAPNLAAFASWQRHEGLQGAFFQGVLMTLLSTPCTAPFLGTAYGWALTGTPMQVIAIFFVIGVGLAAPYVLLTSAPALVRFLPKPGAWMETLKMFMGFPLLATVIWLLSILGSQVGREGMIAILSFLLVLTFALWIFGRGQHQEQRLRHLFAAVLVLLGGGWLTLFRMWDVRQPRAGLQAEREEAYLQMLASEGSSKSLLERLEERKTTKDAIAWVPYAEATVDHFREQERLVLLDFTAEWCATCKANERLFIDTPRVREAMVRYQVVPVRVDYTDQPPHITAMLRQFNRGGVPLYVVYPGSGEPLVLPEAITQQTVLDAFTQAQSVLSRQTLLQER
jgi:thiol:disulfide interchange protein DsbD